MKQEKHEIRCFEIEKRLGKCRFFEKSYKNTRTKNRTSHSGCPVFAYAKGLEQFNAAVRWTAAKFRLDGICSIMSRVPSGAQKNPPGWREAIDKAPEMGYSKDTKGAASRTAPVCYREVTVTFGRVRRLLLFVILENQSNDS